MVLSASAVEAGVVACMAGGWKGSAVMGDDGDRLQPMREDHDQNLKNAFLDFPKEALEWLFPEALEAFGKIRHIDFPRQEPKKRRLSDRGLALDMPILFEFEQRQLLLWLVEFQEDKNKFSIYKVLHYATDMAEAHPLALVIPAVLFTDRTWWRKDVKRQLDFRLGRRVFLRFEYLFVKLFDYDARDWFHSKNPLIKILLPKMWYPPEMRVEVILRAYQGLFELTSAALFEKYVDFIDIYADIRQEERDEILTSLEERKETIMLAEYIKDKGRKEGIPKGKLEMAHEAVLEVLDAKFGSVPVDVAEKVNCATDLVELKAMLKQGALANSMSDFIKSMKN